MSVEQLQLTLTALLPYIAVLVMVIVQTRKYLASFNALRLDVKDEKAVNQIVQQGKQLAALYKDAMDQIQDLKKEIRTLAQTNQSLTSAMNRQNKEG